MSLSSVWIAEGGSFMPPGTMLPSSAIAGVGVSRHNMNGKKVQFKGEPPYSSIHTYSGILRIQANFPVKSAFEWGRLREEMEIPVGEHVRTERSGVGMTLGVVTFLMGVTLLLVTFKLAYDLFSVPPSIVVATTSDHSVDLGRSGANLASLAVRVVLLIVMGLMGSLIANRGISLFTGSRTKRHRE